MVFWPDETSMLYLFVTKNMRPMDLQQSSRSLSAARALEAMASMSLRDAADDPETSQVGAF